MRQECYVRDLQQNIKKEWLLVQKQQQQKRKLNTMLDQSIKSYYSEYVNIMHPGAHITYSEGFQNAYNFVKEVCLILSKQIECGIMLIDMKCSEQIISTIINVLYQSISETEEYSKPICKFMHRIIEKNIDEGKEEIVMKVISILMEKSEISNYFKVVTCPIITKIMGLQFNTPNRTNIGSEIFRSSTINNPNIDFLPETTTSFTSERNSNHYISNLKSIMEIKTTIFQQYFVNIIQEADQCPLLLKIALKSLFDCLKRKGNSEQQVCNKIKKLLLSCYINPIHEVKKKLKQKISNERRQQILKDLQQQIFNKLNISYLKNLINRLISQNQQKYNLLLSMDATNNSSQIITYACCVNYKQLRNMFQLIKLNEQSFKELNPKLISRLNKVYEMSHQLQILNNDKPQQTYVLLYEFQLGKILQLDYQKIHSDIYKDEMMKNIIRQVLYQLGESNFRENISFTSQIKTIIHRQQTSIKNNHYLNLSTALLTKLRYLTNIINVQQQQQLIIKMNKECEERISNSIEVYENSKFILLKAISNIKNKTLYLTARNKKEKIIQDNLNFIKIFNQVSFQLCITSPSSRADSQITDLKYRKSTSGHIIVENIQSCIHKNCYELGINSHATNIKKFIKIFCNLPEVKNSLNNNFDRVGIKSTIQKFILKTISLCKQKYQIPQSFTGFQTSFKTLVMQLMHSNLIQNNIVEEDRRFCSILQNYQFLKSKNLQIPVDCNIEQVWQICSNYLINIVNKNTPDLKIQSLKQVLQILKVAVHNKQNESFLIDAMLIYTIIRSKSKNLISNLNFTFMFLNEQKLLSTEGGILERIREGIQKIKNGAIKEYFNISEESIQTQKKEAEFLQNLRQSKIIADEF